MAATTTEEPVAPVPSTDPQIVSIVPKTAPEPKTDEITAILDSIDGLSLAMFEALRGLRDAVAPESGNTATTSNSSTEPDFEEFWQNYRNADEDTVAAVQRVGGATQNHKREDYIRIYQLVEREKDAGLVATLASRVLEKSEAVTKRVSHLKGMERTRTQQMTRIQDLLRQNQIVEVELKEAYTLAMQKRAQVRFLLQKQTCQALGIEECLD